MPSIIETVVMRKCDVSYKDAKQITQKARHHLNLSTESSLLWSKELEKTCIQIYHNDKFNTREDEFNNCSDGKNTSESFRNSNKVKVQKSIRKRNSDRSLSSDTSNERLLTNDRPTRRKTRSLSKPRTKHSAISPCKNDSNKSSTERKNRSISYDARKSANGDDHQRIAADDTTTGGVCDDIDSKKVTKLNISSLKSLRNSHRRKEHDDVIHLSTTSRKIRTSLSNVALNDDTNDQHKTSFRSLQLNDSTKPKLGNENSHKKNRSPSVLRKKARSKCTNDDAADLNSISSIIALSPSSVNSTSFQERTTGRNNDSFVRKDYDKNDTTKLSFASRKSQSQNKSKQGKNEFLSSEVQQTMHHSMPLLGNDSPSTSRRTKNDPFKVTSLMDEGPTSLIIGRESSDQDSSKPRKRSSSLSRPKVRKLDVNDKQYFERATTISKLYDAANLHQSPHRNTMTQFDPDSDNSMLKKHTGSQSSRSNKNSMDEIPVLDTSPKTDRKPKKTSNCTRRRLSVEEIEKELQADPFLFETLASKNRKINEGIRVQKTRPKSEPNLTNSSEYNEFSKSFKAFDDSQDDEIVLSQPKSLEQFISKPKSNTNQNNDNQTVSTGSSSSKSKTRMIPVVKGVPSYEQSRKQYESPSTSKQTSTNMKKLIASPTFDLNVCSTIEKRSPMEGKLKATSLYESPRSSKGLYNDPIESPTTKKDKEFSIGPKTELLSPKRRMVPVIKQSPILRKPTITPTKYDVQSPGRVVHVESSPQPKQSTTRLNKLYNMDSQSYQAKMNGLMLDKILSPNTKHSTTSRTSHTTDTTMSNSSKTYNDDDILNESTMINDLPIAHQYSCTASKINDSFTDDQIFPEFTPSRFGLLNEMKRKESVRRMSYQSDDDDVDDEKQDKNTALKSNSRFTLNDNSSWMDSDIGCKSDHSKSPFNDNNNTKLARKSALAPKLPRRQDSLIVQI